MLYLKHPSFEKVGSNDINPYKEESLCITQDDLKSQKIHGLFVLKIPANTIPKKENPDNDQSLKENAGQEIPIQDEYQIQVALETSDNQIDFNKLKVEYFFKKEDPSYVLEQSFEIFPRITIANPDLIKEFQIVFKADGKSYAIALRKSGSVDFYYDMRLVSSIENVKNLLLKDQKPEKNIKGTQIAKMADAQPTKISQNSIAFSKQISKIGLTFDKTYFLQTGQDKIDQQRSISNTKEAFMSVESSEINQNIKFENLKNQLIMNHCKLFCSFVFVKTYICVAHAKILSFFDVQKQQWLDFSQLFKTDIIQLFRSGVGNGIMDVCILQENGSISVISSTQEGEFKMITLPDQINGNFLCLNQDREDNRFTFIMYEEQHFENISLYCYNRKKLYLFSQDEIQNMNITKNSSIVFLFSDTDDTRFIIQEQKQIMMYRIYVPEKQKSQSNEDNNQQEQETKPIIVAIWRSEILDFQKMKFSSQQEMELNYKFHSAISISDKNALEQFKGLKKDEAYKVIQEYFFFFNQQHMYLIYKLSNDSQSSLVVIQNQNIKGIYFSDNNYMYTLSNKEPGSYSFRLYDIWNCISVSSALSYELSKVNFGCQPLIDLSHRNQRFVFQSSFDKLDVLPVLHRNTIFFIGMMNREKYISTKVIDDKFIALDDECKITTWSILSGKVIRQRNPPLYNDNIELSNFMLFQSEENQVYQREWFTKSLLINKDSKGILENELNLYYKPEELKGYLANQITFAQSRINSIHEFKLIEIVSEEEIKEIVSFDFPIWQDKNIKQFLYFNDTNDMMLEILAFERSTIYKKIQPNKDSKKCTWQLVKRLTDLPSDFLDINNTQYPFFMSPDFSKYIDISIIEKKKTFIIRQVMTQKQLFIIPQWLMPCNENIKDVINRFKWRSNEQIQVINSEGVERVIKLSENMNEEICFHVIPLFQSEWSKQSSYYYDKPILTTSDANERLKRKYQAYKSVTLMEQNFDKTFVYSKLFTVDYQNYKADEAGNKSNDNHVIDQSFTFLHWHIAEQLAQKQLDLAKINEDQLQGMIYNIFPSGQTILHLLDKSIMEKFLNKCHVENPKTKNLEIKLHLPFVKDLNEKTPMDNLLQDAKMMDKMLLHLTPYGIDHHSREISSLFKDFVGNNLSNLNLYLQSRLQQTNYLQNIKRAAVLGTGLDKSSFWISDDEQKKVIDETGGREVRIEFIDISSMHRFTEDSSKFFKQLSNTEDLTLFEQVAIQKIIDFKWIPTKNYILTKKLVPYLIFMIVFLGYKNQFYQIRQEENLIIYNQGFITILASFCLYFFLQEINQIKQCFKKQPSNEQQQQQQQSIWQNEELINYFSQIWNYLDLIQPITIAIFLSMEFFGFFNYQNDIEAYIAKQRMANFIGNGMTVDDPTVTIRTVEGTLLSIISLLFWLKLLYFMRIWKETGYFIRTIINVIKEMQYFLLLLLFSLIAFADSLRQISSSNPSGSDFTGGSLLTSVGYVYQMILGNFDTNSFGEVSVGYVWVLFILCTLFNMIIMLNLLIAIISESFTNVTSAAQQASYREMADLIDENDFQIDQTTKDSYCPENKYLLVATDIQKEQQAALQFEDQVQKVYNDLKLQTESVQRNQMMFVEGSIRRLMGGLNRKIRDINTSREQVMKLASDVNEMYHGVPLERQTYMNRK